MAIKYGPIVYKVVNKPKYPSVTVTNSGTIDFDLYDGQDATGEKLQEMTAGSTFTATCTSGYLYADFASGEGTFTGTDGVSTGVNPAVVTGDGTWDVAVTAAVTGYSVTFTASGEWTHEEVGAIKIYDGEDNTGILLLNQSPANKSAFPMTLTISSGYCFVELGVGGYVIMGTVSSSDYIYDGDRLYTTTFDVNKNGSIDIGITTWDD